MQARGLASCRHVASAAVTLSLKIAQQRIIAISLHGAHLHTYQVTELRPEAAAMQPVLVDIVLQKLTQTRSACKETEGAMGLGERHIT